jgi:RNA polymerase sigma-70 factor (ECF subfamily)
VSGGPHPQPELLLAREAHPDLPFDERAFTAFLAQRPGRKPLFAGDLLLVHLCLAKEPHALARLEGGLLARLVPVVAAVDRRGGFAEEVLQELRLKLLAEGRLAQYGGRGPLEGWLRRAAINTASHLLGPSKRELPSAEIPEALGTDPELSYLKRQYREGFKAAFATALSGLSARERMVLRLNGLAGYSIDQLGELYHVHRATAARWVQAAKERLLDGTRTALAHEVGVTPAELDEVMGLFTSQLDVSLRRLLELSASRRSAPAPER